MNLNKNRLDRKRTKGTQENINIVQEPLLEDPKISARRNSLDFTNDELQRIVKYDLEWYPYKMRVKHELLQVDYPLRLHLAKWFLQRCGLFGEDFVIGEEAALHMNGRVNNHNVRQYAPRYYPSNYH